MDLDPDGVAARDIDSNDIERALFGTLSIEDWIAIQNVRSSFLAIFQSAALCPHSVDLSDQASALVAWSRGAQQISLLFITFFRQLEEFENLSDADRLFLIKFNLLSVFPIFKCFMHKSSADSSSLKQQEAEEMYRQFYIVCGDSTGVLQALVDLKCLLVQLTEQDPTVLSLLMPMVLFTDGIAMEEDQPALLDGSAVSRAQGHYTQLLWSYLVNRKGEVQTCKYFTELLNIVFRIQKVSKIVRAFFRTQFVTSNIVDQMGPLMQTVLNIS